METLTYLKKKKSNVCSNALTNGLNKWGIRELTVKVSFPVTQYDFRKI